MKQIQAWTGRGWKDIAYEDLPIGVVTIRVIEVENKYLDLDILTPMKRLLEAAQNEQKEKVVPFKGKSGKNRSKT